MQRQSERVRSLSDYSQNRLAWTRRERVPRVRQARRWGPSSMSSVEVTSRHIAATSPRAVSERIGDASVTCAGVAFLVVLWPLVKLAGVFAWNDVDEDISDGQV